jgi:hypothetical protein
MLGQCADWRRIVPTRSMTILGLGRTYPEPVRIDPVWIDNDLGYRVCGCCVRAETHLMAKRI